MKILLVTNMRPSPRKPYSGIFVINQLKRLQENADLQVQLFSMERTFTGPIGSYWKYFKASMAFLPLFFKRFDIIHVHYFFPFIVLAHVCKILRPSTRLVVTFHGSDINEKVNKGNAKFFSRFNQSIDYVISVGQDLADMVLDKLSLKTDQILSAGIDDNVFHVLPGKPKKYHFTFASSFVPRKGIDIFLEAIRQLDRKDISFCFIGSGALESDVRQLAEAYEVDIKLNLKQHEMCEVFNESYYHILPSRFEPFGLVVTESMFCGTPSIVSDVGGIKDQVQHGFNGFILKENSPECLAGQMRDCLSIIENNTYSKYEEGALISNKEHSLTNVIVETEKIYKYGITCRVHP